MAETIPYQEYRDKPWGHEIIYSETERPYSGKIIYVNAGAKLSWQYHTEKEETLCLLSGDALLWRAEREDAPIEKVPMVALKGYTMLPGTLHRVEAVTDVVFLEASSRETGTTVRLSDDYNRPDEVR